MSSGKAIKVVSAVASIASSPNPSRTAGEIASNAISTARPGIGHALAPLVALGTEKLVQKGIDIARDPRTKEAVKRFGASAGRQARILGEAGTRKLQEFRGQIGRR
jgi:hypothetical protein